MGRTREKGEKEIKKMQGCGGRMYLVIPLKRATKRAENQVKSKRAQEGGGRGMGWSSGGWRDVATQSEDSQKKNNKTQDLELRPNPRLISSDMTSGVQYQEASLAQGIRRGRGVFRNYKPDEIKDGTNHLHY